MCVNNNSRYIVRLVVSAMFMVLTPLYASDDTCAKGDVYDEDIVKSVGRCNQFGDRKIGTWQYFYENGQPKIIRNYNLVGLPIGEYYEFYKNGSRKVIGNYHHQAKWGKHGSWQYYDEHGNITKVELYRHGKLARTEKYEIGKPTKIEGHKMGVKAIPFFMFLVIGVVFAIITIAGHVHRLTKEINVVDPNEFPDITENEELFDIGNNIWEVPKIPLNKKLGVLWPAISCSAFCIASVLSFEEFNESPIWKLFSGTHATRGGGPIFILTILTGDITALLMLAGFAMFFWAWHRSDKIKT